MEEKRSSPRYPLEAIVIYYIQNYPDFQESDLKEIGHPRSVDLSRDGMQFVTGQKLPEGGYLKIVLFLAGAGLPIEVIGRVVWIRQLKGQLNYRVGLSFETYTDGSRDGLIHLLDRMEK